MLDSEEQVQQRLPIPLPKAKFRSPGNSDAKTDDDALIATPSASDPKDGDPEVPFSSTQSLTDQLHALTTRFEAYWDEYQEHRVAIGSTPLFSHIATVATTTVILWDVSLCFYFLSVI